MAFDKTNTSLYSNAFQYSGATKAKKEIYLPINSWRETWKYYKLTDRQIHHLLKLQDIHHICYKI